MYELVASRLEMPRSGIREIHELAERLTDVVRLHIGEPSVTTPRHIIEAAAKAAEDGYTHYTPNAGLTSLRELIAERILRKYGSTSGVGQIVVTTGAVTAIASVLLAAVDVGDEVLIPDPGWPNYESMILCQAAIPKRYELRYENGFQPDFEELEKLIGPRTRAIILNSPANPSGVVFNRESIEEFLRIAERYGLYLISDEVYDEIVFEGEHISPLQYGSPAVVGVYSFSKTYAMTGWRVGYAVGPEPLMGLVTKLQESLVSCASSVSQKAAEAALAGPQDFVAEMRRTYLERRDAALRLLGEYEIPHVKPSGTFYLMVNLKDADEGDPAQLARRLLEEYRVAVAPGSTFGATTREMVRLSLAAKTEDILEGIRRIERFVRKGR